MRMRSEAVAQMTPLRSGRPDQTWTDPPAPNVSLVHRDPPPSYAVIEEQLLVRRGLRGHSRREPVVIDPKSHLLALHRLLTNGRAAHRRVVNGRTGYSVKPRNHGGPALIQPDNVIIVEAHRESNSAAK